MNQYDPEHDHRRSIRFKDYDYSEAGAYFVTICTYNRACIFGEITDDLMQLNAYGEIASSCWVAIPEHFPNVEIDEFVIMPNHVHGIVVLGERPIPENQKEGAPWRAPTTSTVKNMTPGSLAAVVVSYKSSVTRTIIQSQGTKVTIWQRNYYEHVIRNEQDLNRIREYIFDNPAKWMTDQNNPNAT